MLEGEATYRYRGVGRTLAFSLSDEAVVVETRSLIQSRRIAVPLELIPDRSLLLVQSEPTWFVVMVGMLAIDLFFIVMDLFGDIGWEIEAHGFMLLVAILPAVMWLKSRRSVEVFHLTTGATLAFPSKPRLRDQQRAFVDEMRETKTAAIGRIVETRFRDDWPGALQYLMNLRELGVLRNEGYAALRRQVTGPGTGPIGFGEST